MDWPSQAPRFEAAARDMIAASLALRCPLARRCSARQSMRSAVMEGDIVG